MDPHVQSSGKTGQLARGLGWFSLALGAAEAAAPGTLARLIGVRRSDSTDAVLRTFGAREMATGLAILAQPTRATWLWSRVGGDLIDLSYLANAARAEGADTRRLSAAMGAVLGVTALDVICAQQLSTGNGTATRRLLPADVHVERVTTVNRPVDEVFRFWSDFASFPRFMKHLEAVEVLDDRRSRWTAKGPAGTTVTWEAEVTERREPDRIAWRSLEGPDVHNSGEVTFKPAPGGRGTEVRVELRYRPPAGAAGRSIAWLFGESPNQQIHEDLRRFKQLMELGEIPLSEGPSLWRAAQPPERREDAEHLFGVQR